MPQNEDYFEVTRLTGPPVRLPNTPEIRFLVDSLPRLPPAPASKYLTVNPTDPEWQKKALESGAEVVAITGGAYAIVRYIPGPAGKVAAFLFVSVAKDPESGRLRPGPPDPLNVAPAPVGFADSEVFGLNRDWWIPPGTTQYLPAIALDLLPGGREAEAKDRFEKALRERDEALFDLKRALDIVKGLPTSSLVAIAERDITSLEYLKQFPLLFDWNFAQQKPSALQAAVAAELAQRGELSGVQFATTEQGGFSAGIKALTLRGLPAEYVQLSVPQSGNFVPEIRTETKRWHPQQKDIGRLDAMFWPDP